VTARAPAPDLFVRCTDLASAMRRVYPLGQPTADGETVLEAMEYVTRCLPGPGECRTRLRLDGADYECCEGLGHAGPHIARGVREQPLVWWFDGEPPMIAAVIPTPPAPRPRRIDVDPLMLQDLLGLVLGEAPSIDAIEARTVAERSAAAEWAACSHLRASDNDDVVVPPKPEWLDQVVLSGGIDA
jgi:hypothetical protein